jgi:hypothetical protein
MTVVGEENRDGNSRIQRCWGKIAARFFREIIIENFNLLYGIWHNSDGRYSSMQNFQLTTSTTVKIAFVEKKAQTQPTQDVFYYGREYSRNCGLLHAGHKYLPKLAPAIIVANGVHFLLMKGANFNPRDQHCYTSDCHYFLSAPPQNNKSQLQ